MSRAPPGHLYHHRGSLADAPLRPSRQRSEAAKEPVLSGLCGPQSALGPSQAAGAPSAPGLDQSVPQPGQAKSGPGPGMQVSISRPSPGTQASISRRSPSAQASLSRSSLGVQASISRSSLGVQASFSSPSPGAEVSFNEPNPSMLASISRSSHGTQASINGPSPGVQARISGPSPGTLASISRPRPTALGTKAAMRPPRVTEELSREETIPVFIPRPQSAAMPQLSLADHTLPLHGTQTPQPGLSPQSPLPRNSPSSPAGAAESKVLEESTGVEAGGDHDFRVYIVTWNVGSSVPPDDITSLFGPNLSDGSIDTFVVGLQEVNSMINKRLKDALFTDQWSELCMDTLSPFGYVLVATQRMQGVLLLVFSKYFHLPFLRDVQTESTRTGLGGCWGNKGGVSARMTVMGHSVCFLNCHLPAHMSNLEQRMEDFQSILLQQQFEGGAACGVLDHDVVFWFGDLNFRIEDYDIHVVKCAIDSNKLPLLWERDQLNMAKNTESILEGFLEGPLKFPPTYKFDVGTHTYDTSAKKRKPAWTDRILWHLRRTGAPVPTHNAALQRGLTSWLGGATTVTQRVYHSHMTYTVSDHKPVSAVFSLHFPFRVEIPLVTLQANREWCKASDATVSFTVAMSYQRSSSDWVAIYKIGFRHHKDYVSYVWVKGENLTQVTFPEEDLPREDGEYILCYYSNNMNSVVGVSSPVQVHIPVHSPAAPGSDSSTTSSEDDSTLVLLTASSRSPSPQTQGAGRQHRRHHGHHLRGHPPPRSPAPLSPNPRPALQGLSLLGPPACRLVSPDDDGTMPTPSLRRPRSPRSPISPSGGVSAPEALVAAILGEHAQVSPTGGSRRFGREGDTGQ